jgi:AH receptor-interacting protein
VKALFRRARAHSGAWNPVEAKSDFEKVSKLDSSLAAACAKEIKKIEEMERKKNLEDKEKMKLLFQSKNTHQ